MGSSRELSALINDILHLATIDAGIMSLDIRETDIADIVACLRRGAAAIGSASRSITLKIDVAEDIGTFHVDPQRVRQILFNLVSNAIRFSNAGGSIRVSARRKATTSSSPSPTTASASRKRCCRASSSASRASRRPAGEAAPAWPFGREEPGGASRRRHRNPLRGGQGDDRDRAASGRACRRRRRRRIDDARRAAEAAGVVQYNSGSPTKRRPRGWRRTSPRF